MNDSRRRLIRWTAGTLIVLLGSAALVTAGAYLYLHSAAGRAHLARVISASLSDENSTVSIGLISGDLPQQIDLGGIAIADARGEWLRLGSVRLQWRPLELIKGKLHVSRIALSDILLSRQPESDGTTATDSPEWPRLPFSVAVDMITLENLTLAEPILGEALTLRASGASALTADGIVRTSFNMERADGAPGKASFEVSFDPARRYLEVAAGLFAPAGGTLSGALDIPGISASLHGAGPIADWHGNIEASSGADAKLTAAIRLEIEDNRYRLRSSGNADIANLLDSPISGLLGDALAFEVDVASADGLRFELAQSRLVSDAASLELRGVIEMAAVDLTAGLRFSERGSAWLHTQSGGLQADNFSLNARATGPLLQPSIDVELRAAPVSVWDGSVEVASARGGSGRFGIAFERALTRGGLPVAVTGEGNFDGVSAEGTDMPPMLAGALSWNFETRLDENIQTLEVARALISSASARLTATGRIGLAPLPDTALNQSPATSVDLDANVTDLTHLHPLLGPIQGGAAHFRSKIEANDFSKGFTASVDAQIEKLQLGAPIADTLAGPMLNAAAEVSVDPAGALRISQLNAESHVLKLSGEVNLSPDFETLRATYKLGVDRIADLVPGLMRGSVLIEGAASGPIGNPALTGTVALNDIYVDNMDAGSALVRFEAVDISSNPEGRIRVSAEQRLAGKVMADARFKIPNFDSIELNDISLLSEGTSAQGKLNAPFDGGAISGNLSGEIHQLDQWSTVAGRELSGSASFDLNLGATEDVQTVQSTVQVNTAVVQLGQAQRLSAGSLALTTQIRDPFGTPSGILELNANKAQMENTVLDHLSIKAQVRDADRAAIELALEGNLPAALQLDLSSEVSRRPDGMEIALNALHAKLAGNPVLLDRPAVLQLAPESVAIDDLSLAVAGGKVQAAGKLSRDTMDAELTLDGLPLSLLEQFYSEAQLEGAVSGGVKLSGTGTAPAGMLQLDFTDVRQKSPRGQKQPKLAGVVRGDWKNNRLALAGTVKGLTDLGLELEASLPLGLNTGTLALQLPQSGAVSGQAAWRGPIQPFLRLLQLVDHDLSGIADLKIAVDGTLGAPRIDGTLLLEQGVYEYFPTATVLKDVSLHLKSDGSRVDAAGTATDGGMGRIRAKGTMSLASTEGLPIDLEFALDKATLVRLDEFTASASGRLALNGPLANVRIGGALVTDQVEAQIITSTAARVEEIDVIEINKPGAFTREEEPTKTGGSTTVGLDIDLKMPAKVFVRGNGLDSEWAGQLKITGSPEAPVVYGELHPIRGGFSFAGKSFDLRSGSVLFDGTKDIDPMLNLPGEYNSADVSAIIAITGRASSPDIKLTSRPSLPESEILSRVLFGKNARELTTGQQIQLASAVANLTGNGAGILDKARTTLGVDVLTIKESADGSTSTLQAGKYVTDRVYVEVEKGAEENTGAATIEVEIAPRVKVQAGSKGQGQGKAGVEWRWDY